MAFHVDEARTMVDAARIRGVRLGVDFNHRFAEPYRRALAFVRSDAFGRPAYADMKCAGDLYGVLNDPYCMLIETQGHSFDLLRLFGGEIGEVSAFLTDPRDIGVYTTAAIAVRFENGAVGSLLGSWDSSYDHPAAVTMEISGTKGRAVIENVIDAVRLYRHDRSEFEEWRPGLFRTDQRDFWRTIDAHLKAFISSIVEGTEPPVTGLDGLRALELTYAAIRSFEERRTMTT
jgi:predicted dehydrogenase